jgi:DNA-binding beta-propeller fold protein YncE
MNELGRRRTLLTRPTVVACVWAAILAAALLGGCGASAPRAAVGNAGTRGVGFAVAHGCPAHVRLSLVAKRSVGSGVDALAVDGATVWVARPQADSIARVTATGTTAIRVGASPISLAAGYGKLWVAERDANAIAMIDTHTLVRKRGASVPVPVGVVANGLGVWALSLDAGAVYPLSPTDGGAGEPIYAPVSDPSEMVASGEELWILGAGNSGLSPVNAKLGRIVRAGFALPGRPLSGLSAAGKSIWLGEPGRHALLRVDAATGAVQELPAPDGIQPTATADGTCGVWVADSSGELAIVDPATGAALGPPLRVGRSIAALAVSGSGVWATDPLDGTLIEVQARASG